jgi:hypothetical protein
MKPTPTIPILTICVLPVFFEVFERPSFPWNPQKPPFLFVFVRILVRFQVMLHTPFLWKTMPAFSERIASA